jgi:hypothetical protein
MVQLQLFKGVQQLREGLGGIPSRGGGEQRSRFAVDKQKGVGAAALLDARQNGHREVSLLKCTPKRFAGECGAPDLHLQAHGLRLL